MKWLWVSLLVVAAIVLAVIAGIAEADPEGRGAAIAEWLMGGAFLALVLAVSISIYL